MNTIKNHTVLKRQHRRHEYENMKEQDDVLSNILYKSLSIDK